MAKSPKASPKQRLGSSQLNQRNFVNLCYNYDYQMLGLIIIFAIGLWALMIKEPKPRFNRANKLVLSRLERFWDLAQTAIKQEKYLQAEKALLTILRIDEKNAGAYNRLGILYAKQENFTDAVECFEIAQSLEPSVNNLHNVGLVYYNIGEYPKAALAFEQALEIDDSLASRHIAYAKVQGKLGNIKKEIKALERAIEIEENPQTLKMLALAYHEDGQEELAQDLYNKAILFLDKQSTLLLAPTTTPATSATVTQASPIIKPSTKPLSNKHRTRKIQ